MDMLSQHSFIMAPCIGCGNKFMVIFESGGRNTGVYVLSAPEFACSRECLARYEVSLKAFLERKPRDG